MARLAHDDQAPAENVTERTALLPRNEISNDDGQDADEERGGTVATKRSTPLPKVQLTVLCLLRMAEPVSLTCIFPFINQMIEELHIAPGPEQVGYYAGLIDSLFALAQFATVLQWGRLSDRVGRKPIILSGLAGAALSSACFGLSQNLAALIATRCLAGALNGNVAVVKSVVGEITDETNQAYAFSFLPMFWAIGCIIGPLLGGFLSHPAERYPSVFGGFEFLKKCPFFLPCAAATLFTLASIAFGAFFLDESLPSKVKPKRDPDTKADGRFPGSDVANDRVSNKVPPSLISSSVPGGPQPRRPLEGPPHPPNSNPAFAKTATPPPPLGSLLTRQFLAILSSYSLLALQTIALDVLITLFCYTSIELGGLGLSPADIGAALGAGGFITMMVQLVVFPPVQRRVGTSKMLKFFMGFYPFIFACFPLSNLLARQGNKEGRIGSWTVLGIMLVLKCTANMVYSCIMIIVNSCAPTRSSLGTLNGISQSMASLMRAIGPATASSLFALSIEKRLAGGLMIWYIMIGLSLISSFVTLSVTEGKGPTAEKDEGPLAEERREEEDLVVGQTAALERQDQVTT